MLRPSPPTPDPLSVRFAKALSELGGLYAVFGVFLQWRSDLLSSGHLAELSAADLHVAGKTRAEMAALVREELGARGAEIAETLSEVPEWITMTRTAYRARVQGMDVIVQCVNNPVLDADILEFEKGIEALGAPGVSMVRDGAILDEFREWLRSGEALETERDYLEAIVQFGGETSTVYPVPLPSLCTSGVLIWRALDGISAAELVARGDPDICRKIATAIFEQFCSLGIVEGELRLDALCVLEDQRLAFRRLARPVPTPPGLTAPALEYVAAAIARDAARTSRALLRLSVAIESPALERELVSNLSGVDPELKIRRWFPASGETFEANWRAISSLPLERRLFLDSLHRNLVATAYWLGDAVRNGAPALDVIAEAQWPVLQRVLNEQMKGLKDPEALQEWLAGSGLLAMGLMKEAQRLAGEVRDNRLSMGFDITHSEKRTRSTRPDWLLPLGALLLAVFLCCVRWGAEAPAGFVIPVRLLTLVAMAGMFWVVLRIR